MQSISAFTNQKDLLSQATLNHIRGGKKRYSMSPIEKDKVIDVEKIDRHGNIKWSKSYSCECK